ncbi:YraN family protein [Corynebacterium sp. A21]|uniref:YraN family protein n=1 Tax=Corynebacterium sp. A21 TaxID=3457318 RepID=UPI003FCF7C86
MGVQHRRRAALGKAGEAHAAGFYRDRGAEIVGQNVSYPVGEIDLIAREPDGTHVFIEVKTRSTLDFGGAESVTPAKRRRVRAAAVRWLETRLGQGEKRVPIRFDVLLLVSRPDGNFNVEYYEGI